MGIFNRKKRSAPGAEPAVPPEDLYLTFPAYQVMSWPEVLEHRRTLERLSRHVENGMRLESIEQYHEGQYDFSFSSPHFQAACKGDPDAGLNYHRDVAGGKYWIFD